MFAPKPCHQGRNLFSFSLTLEQLEGSMLGFEQGANRSAKRQYFGFCLFADRTPELLDTKHILN